MISLKQDLARLVVLISGQGSNLQVVIDACQKGELSAQVVAVVSNRANARGLQRAQDVGILTHVIQREAEESRLDYDSRLVEVIKRLQPDWVVLAGWMHLLSFHFLKHFPHRVINLHPALPGQFPGLHAIQRAFEAWKQGKIHYTGVMVHEVPNEQVDCGPVLDQIQVSIEPEDTLESLTERMHLAEHCVLIRVLKRLITRNVSS